MGQRPFAKGGSALRRLMWFAIGFAGGCAVGAYMLRGWPLLVLTVLVAGALPVVCRLRRTGVRRAVSAALIGSVAACLWFFGYDMMVIRPARLLDGQTQTVTAVANDSWETERGIAVDGSARIGGRNFRVRLYLKDTQEVIPGDEIRGEFRFRFTDVGGAKQPTFHRGQGILLLGYRVSQTEVSHGKTDLSVVIQRLRRNILRTLEQNLPEDTAAFAKALLLGDRSDLEDHRSIEFSAAGISHIIAVSGLHVAILFALVYHLAGKRRYLTAILGIPILLLFAAMVGWTPSVVRATLMQIMAAAALALDREYDPPTALGFSVTVMLIHIPLIVTSVGFQLSAASVAGILLFYSRIRQWLLPEGSTGRWLRMRKSVVSGVSVTISATTLTIPLVGYYFGTISLVAILSNLLVLPVVSLIFYGTAVIGVFGTAFPGIAGVLGVGVSLLIRYVYWVSRTLSSLPLSAVYTKSVYIVAWLVMCGGILGVLLISREKRLKAGLGICAAALAAALTLSYAQPRMEDYRVTALDVGQGSCTLLQCNGAAFVVDCGGSYGADAADQAARTLMSQGIFHLEGLAVTHYDEDHVAGVEILLRRIDVRAVYVPDAPGMEEFCCRLRQIAPDVTIIPVSEDMACSVGEGKITIFAPGPGKSDNDSGIAVLFQRGKYDTLITGDLGTVQEHRLIYEKDLPDCEVLVAGHHGSNHSTSAKLLEHIAPDVVMISVGVDNSYGHPGEQTLRRLAQFGCRILRTDEMGDITYRG